MGMRGGKRALALTGFLTLVNIAVAQTPATAGASGLEGAGVVALVNHQRAVNGIPPITTLDQAYASSWCPREFEAPATEGETGRVSAPEDDWSADSTPYSTAPLHQYVIYAPLATVAGDVHTASGVDCMGVGEPDLLSAVSAPTPSFYAFVNERGPRNAVSSELARELPTTPQQELGDPAGTRTGPQVLLFTVGLGFHPQATAISLRSGAGAAVSNVKLAAQFDGGVLVPPPLKPGTAYELQVDWTGEPQQVLSGFEVSTAPALSATQTLDFATAAAPKRHRPARRPRGAG